MPIIPVEYRVHGGRFGRNRFPHPAELRCKIGSTVEVAVENQAHGAYYWPHKQEKIAYLAFEGPCRIFADKVCSDPTDSDTDGDGLLDGYEWAYGMYIANEDSDGDGLPDEFERNVIYTCGHDIDGIMNYKTNPLVSDTDGDGVSDGQEVYGVVRGVGDNGESGYYFHVGYGMNFEIRFRTNPLNPDTDHDGNEDGTDPIPLDYDMDGDDELNHHELEMLGISEEKIYTDGGIRLGMGDSDIDGDGIDNLGDPDVDNDGMSDVYEVKYGCKDIEIWDIEEEELVRNEVDGEGWQNPWVYNARYALLIGGGGSDYFPMFRKDSVGMYDNLVDDYYYNPGNIYFHNWKDNQGDREGRVDGPADWDSIRSTSPTNYVGLNILDSFALVQNKISNNDFFTFFITGHGRPGKIWTWSVSNDVTESIYYNNNQYDTSFAQEIAKINCKRSVYMVITCYSGTAAGYGGYVSIAGGNGIIITSTGPEEKGWASFQKWFGENNEHLAYLYEGVINFPIKTKKWDHDKHFPGFLKKMGSMDEPSSIFSAHTFGREAALNNRAYYYYGGPVKLRGESTAAITTPFLAENTYW